EGGPIFAGGQPVALASYPIVPWLGVIALGYGMGAVFTQPAQKRERTLLAIGLVMLAAFLVLRGFNLYGEPPAGQGGGPFGRPAGLAVPSRRHALRRAAGRSGRGTIWAGLRLAGSAHARAHDQGLPRRAEISAVAAVRVSHAGCCVRAVAAAGASARASCKRAQ